MNLNRNLVNLFIDPGVKNLAIAIKELNEIHYLKNNTLEENTKLIEEHIVSKIKSYHKIRIYIEKQIVYKNIFLEGLIIGFFTQKFINHDFKIIRLSAKIKVNICRKFFFIKYMKFNRKHFKLQSSKFKDTVTNYKIKKYENNLIQDTTILTEKKIDDIIDVYLMTLYRSKLI